MRREEGGTVFLTTHYMDEAEVADRIGIFGVFVASRIEKMEGFQVVMQLVLLPMIFLSGAMFPLTGLPVWLTRINLLTYAVARPRTVVFHAQHIPAAAVARFPTEVTLFRYTLSVSEHVLQARARADTGFAAGDQLCR